VIINDLVFSVELIDIINELQAQLHLNQIPLLNAVRELPHDIMITCPYHKGGQERRPSAGIRKHDGQFHCLACGETHSLQEMISHCFGYSDDLVGAFGWNWLLKNFLTVAVETRKDIDLDFVRESTNEVSINYVSEEELDRYRFIHPYMYKRKLTDDVIEMFDVGYDKNTKCITFPVRDIDGNTLFIARRSVVTKFFNYPEGVEKPVYGLHEVREWARQGNDISEIIICESMIDALTCWVYGKPAVALNGTGDDLQFVQLNKMPCRKFILATDNDAAGMKARRRLRKNLKGKLITEYVFPEGRKDINDLSLEEFNSLVEIF
jgi:DNA primase